jgi:hypothetical protein
MAVMAFSGPCKRGELIMTREFNVGETQVSRFNSVVVGTFMGAVIVIAGILSFAPYSLI